MPRDLSIFYMVLEPDKLTLTIKSFNFKYLFVYPKTVSVHSPDSPETQYADQAIDKTETTSVSKVLN